MEKITGVEILKGRGFVLYEPQNNIGVVNLTTKDLPSESTGTGVLPNLENIRPF